MFFTPPYPGMNFPKVYNKMPVSAMGGDLSNSIEDGDDDGAVIEDDITTHGLERLSSAATCLVAGVEYTHGQQIYRKDPCEFCLCLDGEMFCWWQDCPPTMEGPCRDRGPFSPCISIPSYPSSVPSQPSSTVKIPSTSKHTTTASTTLQTTARTTSSNSSATDPATNPAENMTDTSLYTEETEVEYSSEDPSSSTAQEPKHCIVMGREYQIGDRLPHNTGNCIECICGHGAKVTCSPHQCSPAGADDLNEYHPPGPRQPIPDVF